MDTNNSWKTDLNDYLLKEISLLEISSFFKTLKEKEIERNDIRQHLYELRTRAIDEIVDDRILEILDIVESWCNERYRVW